MGSRFVRFGSFTSAAKAGVFMFCVHFAAALIAEATEPYSLETFSLSAATMLGAFFSYFYFFLVWFLLGLLREPRDSDYWLRLSRPGTLWKSFLSRWILILGGIGIAFVMIMQWEESLRWSERINYDHRVRPGFVAVPFVLSIMVLWLADIFRRPSKQALFGWIIFITLTLFVWLPALARARE